MDSPPKRKPDIEDLKALIRRLRAEDGCPWDRRQTPESLKIYLLEEAYELAEALDRGEVEEIREELGDLLFQILFLCRVHEEQGLFDLDQVIEQVLQKMIRRHPHVFGDQRWENSEEVVRGWQAIKAEEKKGKDPFDSIPKDLPALLKAHRISQRAAGMGFDWSDTQGVLNKVREELKELEEAIEQGNPASAHEELGDLLFTLVNLGRFLKIPAENALGRTIQKFLKRFRWMTEQTSSAENPPSTLSEEAWEALWERSKQTVG